MASPEENSKEQAEGQAEMSESERPRISRRGLLGVLGMGTSLGVAGYATAANLLAAPERTPAPRAEADPSKLVVPFAGFHQAGIATPAQSHVLLTTYDMSESTTPSQLAAVFKSWTHAARLLTSGSSVKSDPLISTGNPASLTVTVAVGGNLVRRLGAPFPAALSDLPAFAGDKLDPAISGGDVAVQLCADDPLVLAEADRVLSRLATTHLIPRWQQSGFGSTGARRGGTTGRNLMGQLDGTNNVTTSQLTKTGPIWVSESKPSWMFGGSYMVIRKIRMLLNDWDNTTITHQEQVIGRYKHSGAPLGSEKETDYVDLAARNPDNSQVIPDHSHVRLATPRHSGENMMRRGYSYRGQLLPDGTTDQGLLFVSYQKDPRTSFVKVQTRLAAADALSEYTVATGSGIFAVLPGVHKPTDWLGSDLFR